MARNVVLDESFENGLWLPSYNGTSVALSQFSTTESYRGSYCGRLSRGGSGDTLELIQYNICQIGQEYTISFYARSFRSNSAIQFTAPFDIGEVGLTENWKKYSFTGIATSTAVSFTIPSSFTNSTILVDVVRIEPTPIKYTVLRGQLSLNGASPDTDFTEKDFGTPKAAIVIMSNAQGATTNFHGQISIGFWDGTNQRCMYASDQDGITTSSAWRGYIINRIGYADVGGVKFADYTIANITNGVRITLSYDNTSIARMATVILFSGHDLETAVTELAIADDGVAQNSSLSFRPDVLFGVTVGDNTTGSTFSEFSFGVTTRQAATYKNYSTSLVAHNGVTTSNTASIARTNRMAGQISDTLSTSWFWETTQFNADGFQGDTDPNNLSSTYGDKILYLALKAPGVNFEAWYGGLPSTDGNVSTTGIGFKPGILIGCFNRPTSSNSIYSSYEFTAGAGTLTQESSVGISSLDNLATTVAKCRADEALVGMPRAATGNIGITSTIVSFDSDGFTLNHSGAFEDRRGWILCIQDPDDTKKDFGTSAGRLLVKQ